MSLKQKLIQALAPLSDLNPPRFADIRNALKAVEIPDDNYKEVVTFIIVLSKDMPEIVYSPQIKKLSVLSQQCDAHLKTMEETLTKTRPGKRK